MSVWSIEIFEEPSGYSPFGVWVKKKLTPAQVAALDSAIRHILAPNGISLSSSKWIKLLGQGLFEFRISHTAEEIEGFYKQKGISPSKVRSKVLLRVFVHFYGNKAILILSGYDKGAHDGEHYQQKQVNQARKYLGQWKIMHN